MVAALATLADFVRLGLPAPALVPAPRPVEVVDATLDRILVFGHGLLDGDEIRMVAGAGVLPSPLSATDRYGIATVDLDMFQLVHLTGALTGQTVDITTTGTKPIEYRADPRPAIEKALLAASSIVQDHATAHSEITVSTEQIKSIVCTLAADIMTRVNRLRLPLNEKQLEDLRARVADVWITLRTWLKGKPIAGVVDATPGTAETGAIAALITPLVGQDWGWGCGL